MLAAAGDASKATAQQATDKTRAQMFVRDVGIGGYSLSTIARARFALR
jgi:hypothetical protein